MRRLSIVLLTGATALAACDAFGPRLCPDNVNPAIVVEVRDAVSGDPAAVNSVGTLRSGAFIEMIDPLGALTLISERAGVGTYRVEVRKAGYRDWVAEDVRVRETGRACPATQTVTLRATLEPVP